MVRVDDMEHSSLEAVESRDTAVFFKSLPLRRRSWDLW